MISFTMRNSHDVIEGSSDDNNKCIIIKKQIDEIYRLNYHMHMIYSRNTGRQ